jgi:prevent-host-death family protein
MVYNIGEARNNFEKLTARALAGQEVILARRNEPVAELLPVVSRKRPQRKRRRKAN